MSVSPSSLSFLRYSSCADCDHLSAPTIAIITAAIGPNIGAKPIALVTTSAMPLTATFKTPVILFANCCINGSSLVPLNTLNTPSIFLIFAKAFSAITNASVTVVKSAIVPVNVCATTINGGKICDAPSKANCHCSNEAIHD